MATPLPVQVKRDHYQQGYDDLPRFISYFHQADQALSLHPRHLLEIGIGNGTVGMYLRRRGVTVTTCDFDRALEPDIVADIRELPLPDNSHDVVMACEILEHLPWKDVPAALREIARVSSKHVIISLPYASLTFGVSIRFSLIQRLFRTPFLDVLLRVPLFLLQPRFTGEHYWEMGKAGCSRATVRALLRQEFTILKEVRPMLHSSHYFFVLEKKKALIG